MRLARPTCCSLLFAVFTLIGATVVGAQELVPRGVGVFADSQATQIFAIGWDFVPINIYVVGSDLDGMVKGYEFEFQMPPAFTVLSATMAGPNPLNVGTSTNVIVGAGGCFDGLGKVVLVTYRGGFFAPGAGQGADLQFCLGPAAPSSFSPASPGYLQCDNTLVPFADLDWPYSCYPAGCTVLNPICTVPVEPDRFGALKARWAD